MTATLEMTVVGLSYSGEWRNAYKVSTRRTANGKRSVCDKH